MTVRRFVGINAREALRQVREALGENAMIVANRRIGDGVEVLALAEAAVAALEARAVPASDPQPRAAVAAPVPVEASGADGAVVMDALGDLRGSLERRLDGILWGADLRRAPVGVSVFRELLGAGFSTSLARALVSRLPDGPDHEAAMAWVRGQLADKLPVHGDEAALFAAGGVFALIGPTGVGKTTTTAKLAARCVMRYGAERVAMLTTDGYRVGAHEQLLIYGRILGIPVLPATDAQALHGALHELRGKHIVLIDTIGMSQRDRNVAEQAAMLCAVPRPVRRLLVLNAASQGDTLDEVAHAYRQGAEGWTMGCIISKVDEAGHLGAALDIAIRHRLPIHYVSDGQKVPENFQRPSANELIDRAFAANRGSALYAPEETDFAAIWKLTGASAVAAPVNPARQALRLRHLQAAAGGAALAASPAAFLQALASLQARPAVALARQAWRELIQDGGSNGDLAQALMVAALAQPELTGGRCLLAVHGRLRTPAAGRAPSWRHIASSLVFSAGGQPLAAPVAHVHTRYGVMATSAPEQPLAPAATMQTLLDRIDWLEQACSARAPLVHVVDGLTATLAGQLTHRGLAWLARCPAHQAVLYDGVRATAVGVASALGYAPAGTTAHKGRAAARWLGSTAVCVPQPRGGAALDVCLLVLRVVDAASGEELERVYAMCCLRELPDVETLAQWMELGTAVRCSPAWAAAALRRVGARDAGSLRPASLLAAAQLGLAGWALAREPDEISATVLGTPLTGERGMVDALAHLFAALEIATEDGV